MHGMERGGWPKLHLLLAAGRCGYNDGWLRRAWSHIVSVSVKCEVSGREVVVRASYSGIICRTVYMRHCTQQQQHATRIANL